MILERVGRELAASVADRLAERSILAYHHRDYCGIGLGRDGGRFIHAHVYDGFLPDLHQAMEMQERGTSECMVFPSEEAFIAWLEVQSDESLSGRHLADRWHHDNQRITIARLRRFVAGEEEG